jgi:hypothetical protein
LSAHTGSAAVSAAKGFVGCNTEAQGKKIYGKKMGENGGLRGLEQLVLLLRVGLVRGYETSW